MNKKEISIIPHRKKIISPFQEKILGVNLEITRTGFFGGLSAQMLNNRKLYMGETSVDGWEAENFERITDRIEDSLCLSNYIILKKGGSRWRLLCWEPAFKRTGVTDWSNYSISLESNISGRLAIWSGAVCVSFRRNNRVYGDIPWGNYPWDL